MRNMEVGCDQVQNYFNGGRDSVAAAETDVFFISVRDLYCSWRTWIQSLNYSGISMSSNLNFS